MRTNAERSVVSSAIGCQMSCGRESPAVKIQGRYSLRRISCTRYQAIAVGKAKSTVAQRATDATFKVMQSATVGLLFDDNDFNLPFPAQHIDAHIMCITLERQIDHGFSDF
jgi:hypothetical protein